jgi:hypothetical protein
MLCLPLLRYCRHPGNGSKFSLFCLPHSEIGFTGRLPVTATAVLEKGKRADFLRLKILSSF